MLFDCDRSVVTKHLRNIFDSEELNESEVCAKFAHTASDGKTYQTQFYNLDAVISVGYRVNSIRATQFRQWATRVLNRYAVFRMMYHCHNSTATSKRRSVETSKRRF